MRQVEGKDESSKGKNIDMDKERQCLNMKKILQEIEGERKKRENPKCKKLFLQKNCQFFALNIMKRKILEFGC